MIGFPPIVSYPLALDDDRSLYLVYNTAETILTVANSAWAEEIYIQPRTVDQEEIWADNGFANISGELFYYDNVGYDINGKVNRLKNCARNLAGTTTQHNPVGTYVRGFVIAEHHNQIVKALVKIEEFVGIRLDCDNLGEIDTLTRRIKELECQDECIDDGNCPNVDFDFTINPASDDKCAGIVMDYSLNIQGNYDTFKLDFGDGSFTTSPITGSHVYSPNSNIDPVIFIANDNCQIMLTDISRTPTTEPKSNLPQPLFIPVPTFNIPNISVPSISIPLTDISIPPIVMPCIDIPSFPNFSIPNISIPGFSIGDISINVPSLISITPINIPSLISITPINLPSIISIVGPMPALPSIISIVGPTLPSVISIIGNLPSTISLIGSLPSVISIIGPSLSNISLIVPSIPNVSLIVPSIPNISIIAPSIPDISVIFPSIPDINISVNVPSISFPNINVSVNFPNIPDINVIDNIPDIITVIDNIPTIINVVDNIPTTINVNDNIPSSITVECCSEPISIDWGSVPTLSVDWGSTPSITCVVSCGGATSMAIAKTSLLGVEDDPTTIEMGYDFTGIPSEINLVIPDISDINLVHNLPSEISFASFPSVISFSDLEKIPNEIILNTTGLPKSISIESTLPSVITIDGSNIPNQINVVNVGIPSIITIESTLPSEISVVGMPTSISVTGFPDSIKVDPVEMVYKGAPIEMVVKVDMQSALGADVEGKQKFYIIPAV